MPPDYPARMTKIVATLGPASDPPEVLEAMLASGVSVVRLNLSHGTHEEHAGRLARVRELAERLGLHVAVMLDTRGLEIRTGLVASGEIELVPGRPFTLFSEPRPGDAGGVSVDRRLLAQEVAPGRTVFVDDGRIELRVLEVAGSEIRCQVVRGGVLGSRKGVYVPDLELVHEDMDEHTEADLAFAAQHDFDYVAVSFVRSAEDVRRVRKELGARGAELPLIAKIETREAVEGLDEIVAEADGTMVARGDLGVALAVEEVPLAQKRIIHTTVGAGKPVITATQMLDSMERNASPTRAESSDVANAILDGTSAVMLSGETARGRYPVEAVRTMARLALRAESGLREYGDLQRALPQPAREVTDAVAQAAIGLAGQLRARAIVSLTESGFTARSVSKYRPRAVNLAVTSSPRVMRRLALNWGVTPVFYEGERDDDEARADFGVEAARRLGYVVSGDVVVVTAGISREPGSTRSIRVVTVP
jgi:pyruvate kinase